MKKNIILGISLLLLSSNILAQKEENLGNWLMYFGTHKLNEKFSLHYETQLRNYKITSNFNQLLPRVGINYKIDDNAMVTAGYALIPTQSEFESGWNEFMSIENRVWQQFILRNKIKNISLRHRYRLEQRWIKSQYQLNQINPVTTTYKNRARYMLSVKFPLSKNEDFPLFISIYDEIFLNISDTPFDQNRLFGALGFQVNKNMNIQAGYLRHRSGDLNLNRLQLAVFLNTGN